MRIRNLNLCMKRFILFVEPEPKNKKSILLFQKKHQSQIHHRKFWRSNNQHTLVEREQSGQEWLWRWYKTLSFSHVTHSPFLPSHLPLPITNLPVLNRMPQHNWSCTNSPLTTKIKPKIPIVKSNGIWPFFSFSISYYIYVWMCLVFEVLFFSLDSWSFLDHIIPSFSFHT